MRLVDSCFTQVKAQGPSRTCNESKEEEEEEAKRAMLRDADRVVSRRKMKTMKHARWRRLTSSSSLLLSSLELSDIKPDRGFHTIQPGRRCLGFGVQGLGFGV